MRIAIVGTGSIGRRHISNLLALGLTDLCVVSEYSKRTSFELNNGIEAIELPVIHSYEECLSRCDAVVIANPSSMHMDYTSKAIAAGKHIYLEKPVALSTQGIEILIQQANDKGLTIAVGTQFRFNQRLNELKSLLDNKELGKLLSIIALSGEHIADYHPEENYRISYAARSELGGGVLLTQIHQIDYVNWLFGDFEQVMAAQVETPELGIDVESCVTYFFKSSEGFSVTGNLNYLQRPKCTKLEVIGSLGKAVWNYEENLLEVIANDGSVTRNQSPFDRNQMFFECMQDFLDSIASGTAPKADLSAGFEALQLVDLMKRSFTDNKLMRR